MAPHQKQENNFSSNPYVVHTMCDRAEPLTSNIAKKFFEPGCGDGAFLVEVINRRLENTHHYLQKILIAVSNIHALDINPRKVIHARAQLFKQIQSYTKNDIIKNYRFWPNIEHILQHNIICADYLKNHEAIFFYDWSIDEQENLSAKKYSLDSLLKNKI